MRFQSIKMNFRTIVPIKETDSKIEYQHKILSLGSCFAVNIAKKLEWFNFQIITNPFGILFHPLAIENLIERAVNNQTFSEVDFFELNQMWHCFDFHSELSQNSLKDIENTANYRLSLLRKSVIQSDYLFITLGTAWVYIHNKKAVANCHKVPQNQFIKQLLSVAQIEKSLQNIINLVRKINPTLNVIFSISPVRHLKDGFIENQISKAHLVAALHSFLSKNSAVGYFPAYEIMLDELRDYRFYDDDMLHPSAFAIEYIWKRFSENHISSTCFNDMKLVDNIQKGLKHRPFNTKSEEYIAFKRNLNKKIDDITQKYPFMFKEITEK